MTLATRDHRLAEMMDDPHCDPVRLRRTLERFGVVNRAVTSWGRVYRSHVRPVLAGLRGPARILDIGCGGGDVLNRIVRLARRDGFAADGVGIDPDPRAFEVARDASRLRSVSFRRALSRDLVAEGAQFDVVISNHLLHHLDDERLAGLLADSETLAERLCVHSDIARSGLAYRAFSIAAIPLAPGTFLRVDGLRSIRRSYTRDELSQRLPPGWRAEQPAPFRLIAVHEQGTAAP